MIMEPCNYASNIAYYHSAMRVCDQPYTEWNFDLPTRRALKQGFVTLAAGSAMMHGSHTYLGDGYDCLMIGVIAYTGYRAIVEKLGANTRAVLSLTNDYDAMTGLETAEGFAYFSNRKDLSEWRYELSRLASLFPGDYFITFTGLVHMIIYILLPEHYADLALDAAMKACGFDEHMVSFFTEQY